MVRTCYFLVFAALFFAGSLNAQAINQKIGSRDIKHTCGVPVLPWYWDADPCDCETDPTHNGYFAGRSVSSCKNACARPAQWKFNSRGDVPLTGIGRVEMGVASSISYSQVKTRDIVFDQSRYTTAFAGPLGSPYPACVVEGNPTTDEVRNNECALDYPFASTPINIHDAFGNENIEVNGVPIHTGNDCINGAPVPRVNGIPQGTEPCPLYDKLTITEAITSSDLDATAPLSKTFQGWCDKYPDPDFRVLESIPRDSFTYPNVTDAHFYGCTLFHRQVDAATNFLHFNHMDVFSDPNDVLKASPQRWLVGGSSVGDGRSPSYDANNNTGYPLYENIDGPYQPESIPPNLGTEKQGAHGGALEYAMSLCVLNYSPPTVDKNGNPHGSYVDKDAIFICDLVCVYDAPIRQSCPDGASSC